MRPRVGLPARLEGGPGDDCLQSGSGGDQLLGGGGNDVLIPGTGRPALQTGTGSTRIVVPQRMGELRVLPSAKSRLLPLLAALYRLRAPIQGVGQIPVPTPIVIGADALSDAGVVPMLRQTYDAGQSIVLLRATADDAARLRSLLGHPNAAEGLEGGEVAALIYFRKSPRPGSTAFDYSAGIIRRANLTAALSDSKEPIIELLSQIFSETAIVPGDPSDTPSNDLQTLADSYTTQNIAINNNGSSAQIVNSVWAVRSFQNSSDFYYVQNRVNYYASAKDSKVLAQLGVTAYANSHNIGTDSVLIQESPGTTVCTQTSTSGTAWNIGGSAGWAQDKGFNATLTGGVSITNTSSLSCPDTRITDQSNPGTGQTQWLYKNPGADFGQPRNYAFVNQWIWEVLFTSYTPPAGVQTQITISSTAYTCFDNDGPFVVNGKLECTITGELADATLESVVPLPFDNTFALQPPAVTSVTPTCVAPGGKFTINGTALYPSLVTSVAIGGTPLASGSYTPASDTSIDAFAPPSTSRTAQAVGVQTGIGLSNSNVTVTVSSSCPGAS